MKNEDVEINTPNVGDIKRVKIVFTQMQQMSVQVMGLHVEHTPF